MSYRPALCPSGRSALGSDQRLAVVAATPAMGLLHQSRTMPAPVLKWLVISAEDTSLKSRAMKPSPPQHPDIAAIFYVSAGDILDGAVVGVAHHPDLMQALWSSSSALSSRRTPRPGAAGSISRCFFMAFAEAHVHPANPQREANVDPTRWRTARRRRPARRPHGLRAAPHRPRAHHPRESLRTSRRSARLPPPPHRRG